MATPDEIKKGLECCYSPVEPMQRCEACPYYGSIVCKMRLHTDALAYIQQLEHERDAAVKDISMGSRCTACRKFFKNDGDCSGGVYCVPLRFEWRGVKED